MSLILLVPTKYGGTNQCLRLMLYWRYYLTDRNGTIGKVCYYHKKARAKFCERSVSDKSEKDFDTKVIEGSIKSGLVLVERLRNKVGKYKEMYSSPDR